jgi:TolB-like protein/DNA-binding winged helix-turn-helix (wHTH) protein/Tfp pilus assembly protein PilF
VSVPGQPSRRVRFGDFELDLLTGELNKQGRKPKLHGQPARVLTLLASQPGRIITREELRNLLWPGDTFVDFDHGLNNAINRIREVLGDSATSPHYIETLPKQGYRFIATLEASQGAPHPSSEPESNVQVAKELAPAVAEKTTTAPPLVSGVRFGLGKLGVAGLVIVGAAAVLLSLNAGRLRQRFLGQRASEQIQIRSIAVLPLENLTGDPGQEYFVDGMTDALITDLAQIGSLRVISRTSVMQYKGVHKPLPEIGRELSVDAVVEGTVSRVGNTVRITAQLVRTSSDAHLWAQDYQRDLNNVFALQNEVARDIAGQVQIKLTAQEQARLAAKHLVNPAAQEAYLKGLYFLNLGTVNGTQKAIEFFQQAVAIDPGYALAYAGLADGYVLGAGKQFSNDQDFAQAKRYAWKAISLDSSLAEPHAALGRIAVWSDNDSIEGQKQFGIAFKMNPNLATAHVWYGTYLLSVSDFADAEMHYRRAYEVDPASAVTNARFGDVLVVQRRFEEAIPILRKALELNPNLWLTHDLLGDAYLGTKNFHEARSEFQKAKEFLGLQASELSEFDALAALADALGGRRVEAEEVLDRIRKQRNCHLQLDAAGISAALGYREEAYAWLDKTCHTVHDVCAPMLNWLPAFDPLRDEPRFQEVVRRASSPTG